MTGHPSSLDLDAHAHGFAADEAVGQHADTCARCRGIVETAREDAARFSRSVLPRTLDVVAARRPRFSLAWALAPMVAVAALVVWLRIPGPVEPAMNARVEQATPVERERRSTATLSAFAQAAGQGAVRRLGQDAPVAVGELLRVSVEERALPFVVVLSVDARRVVTVRAPIEGGPSLELDATGKMDLPGSWLVERDTAPVQIVALFSSRALASDEMRDLLASGHALPADVVEQRLGLTRAP